eukprot:g13838.t1
MVEFDFEFEQTAAASRHLEDMLEAAERKLWHKLCGGQLGGEGCVFVSFADLKKYHFFYTLGFPYFKSPCELVSREEVADAKVVEQIEQISRAAASERVVKCYVVQKGARKPKLLRIKFRQPPPQQVVAGEKIEPPQKSFVAGWLKNESGSSVVRHVDLAQWLNPAAIARSAVDLNIKLMKWRLPERMQELKFLMLGSGTLGCALARNLLGWGVRHITFLDSGIVNFSNPVRQSLFTHQDAVEQRGKAETAFQRARDVMPELEGAAVRLEIPMPGHPASYNEDSISKLRELVESHDVVCMLTDSRESRWLPSLLVAEAKKPILGLTVALGFDSFVVMTQSCGAAKRACYFCNDVSAPSDSIKERTLDRQCTVVRPGVSGLASSLAAELVAALSQHRQGFEATKQEDQDEVEDSLLGKVPNQIRGYLNDYRLVPIETEPFKHCVCCSEQVREAYRKEPIRP